MAGISKTLSMTCLLLCSTVMSFADQLHQLPSGIEDSATYIDEFNSAPVAVDPSDNANIEIINERYDTGQVKIRREVTQDKDGNYIQHGEWRAFDRTGNQLAVGRYQNGIPDGRWTYVHSAEASKLYTTIPYKNFEAPFTSAATLRVGQLHGTWTITDSQRRKISVVEVIDGKRNGLCKLYFPQGQLMQEIPFVQGQIHGQLRQWDAQGNLIVDDTYQKARKLANRVGYDKTGKKKSEGVYLHPEMVLVDPDDWWRAQPATYKMIGDPKRHGGWTEWHENGKYKVVGRYSYNQRDGEVTWRYPNGQKQVSGSYRGGVEYGIWLWWHDNGQKMAQGYFDRGSPTEMWTFWRANGLISQKLHASEITLEILKSELNASFGNEDSTADRRNDDIFGFHR